MARVKKLTDSTYSPTIAASEEAIRTQIDDSIQEAHDLALEDVTINRKLSATGDFTGTINGGDVTLTEPGLSGAFNAHLADNEQQAINMLTKGAKIDGSDTSVLIQAILTANGEGKRYFFPEGTYIFESYASFPSNCIIDGIPGKTIFKIKDGSTANPMLVEVSGKTNVRFCGITIEGNIDNITNFNNICTTYQSSKVTFEFCKFQNTRGVAVIFSTDISNSGLRFCDFNNCGTLYLTTDVLTDRKQAIAFTSGTLENNRGNFVDFCNFDTVGSDCISATSQYNFRCVGNIIKKNYAGSIYISSSRNVKASLNEVENEFGGNGIDISNCKGVSAVGNTCRKCGAAGILLADSSDATVTGNVCKNNKQGTSTHQGGITINSATAGVIMSNITLSGNVCTDDQDVKTQEYGIQWVSGAGSLSDIHVDKSNQLKGNKTAELSSNLHYDGAIDLTLAAGESVTVCNSAIYGFLDVVRYNDSVVGRLYLRSNQSPLILNDYTGSKFFNTDTGTEIAVYYDSGTSSIILKNKTAVTRAFKFKITIL
jgi:parallel beta-helix repeat protein